MDNIWNEHGNREAEFDQIQGYFQHLFETLTLEWPEDMEEEKDDEDKEHDEGNGRPEGFFDLQAMEVDKDGVRREEKAARVYSELEVREVNENE
ncbi:hypothetical protein VKT23_005228 [Stygiomarasmius scandens]|uniref:Uncharacterized protein n=1 Tax=Marasmiellus scandens TaxID=2682957 RepID=A0ABR1JTG2_9AGAR